MKTRIRGDGTISCIVALVVYFLVLAVATAYWFRTLAHVPYMSAGSLVALVALWFFFFAGWHYAPREINKRRNQLLIDRQYNELRDKLRRIAANTSPERSRWSGQGGAMCEVLVTDSWTGIALIGASQDGHSHQFSLTVIIYQIFMDDTLPVLMTAQEDEVSNELELLVYEVDWSKVERTSDVGGDLLQPNNYRASASQLGDLVAQLVPGQLHEP